jgi:hypothetical protein
MDGMVEKRGLILPYFSTSRRSSIQPGNNLASNPIDNALCFASKLCTLSSNHYIPFTLTCHVVARRSHSL